MLIDYMNRFSGIPPGSKHILGQSKLPVLRVVWPAGRHIATFWQGYLTHSSGKHSDIVKPLEKCGV